ncbi:hypothetical protein F7725_019784 [Dissostichus mawsoni]|uniref:Uncharacterized protein n=1 Tax=Dissostichus mawsoni TaxID=36200 RepID=A0A7J5YKT6_DISMA|nr:hypothetical protein F7725_019784 [Dissostichus mawsoni]
MLRSPAAGRQLQLGGHQQHMADTWIFFHFHSNKLYFLYARRALRVRGSALFDECLKMACFLCYRVFNNVCKTGLRFKYDVCCFRALFRVQRGPHNYLSWGLNGIRWYFFGSQYLPPPLGYVAQLVFHGPGQDTFPLKAAVPLLGELSERSVAAGRTQDGVSSDITETRKMHPTEREGGLHASG